MQLTSQYNNTSSVTKMLEDVGLHNLEQCQIDNRLRAFCKITWGLLSVNSNGLLHPVTHRTRHSDEKSFIVPFKLACPLGIYPFSQEQWNNIICLLLSEANTALYILSKPM